MIGFDKRFSAQAIHFLDSSSANDGNKMWPEAKVCLPFALWPANWGEDMLVWVECFDFSDWWISVWTEMQKNNRKLSFQLSVHCTDLLLAWRLLAYVHTGGAVWMFGSNKHTLQKHFSQVYSVQLPNIQVREEDCREGTSTCSVCFSGQENNWMYFIF